MHYVPNVLTVGRILLTPLILLALTTETLWGQAGALVLFLVAATSDYLDGQIARQMDVHSRLGRFLDPLADKVLVLGTFIMLAYLYPQIILWWAVALIALRDVGVTGLRLWAEARGLSLQTHPLAKTKTAAQLGFLIWMLVVLTAAQLPDPFRSTAAWVLEQRLIPIALLLGVMLLTLLTGALYAYHQDYAAAPEPAGAERTPVNSSEPSS